MVAVDKTGGDRMRDVVRFAIIFDNCDDHYDCCVFESGHQMRGMHFDPDASDIRRGDNRYGCHHLMPVLIMTFVMGSV